MDEEEFFDVWENITAVFNAPAVSGIAHAERAIPQGRKSGQFGGNLTSQYRDVMQQAGKQIKDFIIENYQESGIGQKYSEGGYASDGLYAAVRASTVDVIANTKILAVTVQMGNAEQTRPTRPGEQYAAPTYGELGAWLFGGMHTQYITPIAGKFLHVHFGPGQGWTLLKGVKAPTPHPIFKLSDAQMKVVSANIRDGLVGGVKAMVHELVSE